ncbi:PLP-dependent aminotransferase family protein [Xanthobacter sp. KR7-225]|uniref:MocR-like pyridoxine biosynthesis transcription factor PdxR n=1 Tax=Xanthobacter sp. KR7-225 TaxID=3156613 RepID=UPI0032B532D4
MLQIALREGHGSLPIHRQIADQIRYQIEHGEVEHGAMLPSSRDLARELGVARGTVVLAYEELCAAGVCESHVGRGTRVKRTARREERPVETRGTGCPVRRLLDTPDEPVFIDPRELSLLPSIADIEHLPITQLRRGFDRVLRRTAHLKFFTESAGDPMLRRQICEHILPERGIEAHPDEVLVIPGTQYGAVLIALTQAKERRNIHFGTPGYLDIARNFARFGFDLHDHPVDAGGILLTTSDLGKNDILYVMPEHHFPQCVTLSDARRAEIVHAVEQRDLLVIEDDYDSEFYYDRRPRPALKASNARDGVIYLGTFSKTLFNSLRLGYVVAEPPLVREMATLHWSLSRGTSGVLQRWVAELLDGGIIAAHTRRMRTVYRRKRDRITALLRREFPHWRFDPPRGGLQFFLDLGSAGHASEVIAICRAQKLRVALPSNYVMNGKAEQQFLVLGFGSAALSQIESALLEVKRALHA